MSDKTDYAIILGTTAIVVAVITQVSSLFLSLHDKKSQRKDLLRKKYEEMMFHFSESLEYIVHLNGSTNLEAVLLLAQCPSARRALNLCALYFRELMPAANNYLLSLSSYYNCIIASYDKNDSLTAGGQSKLKSPDYDKELENVFQKKDEFEHLIMNASSKYTQPIVFQLLFFGKLKSYLLSWLKK